MGSVPLKLIASAGSRRPASISRKIIAAGDSLNVEHWQKPS